MTSLQNATVLVTGANGGLGTEFVPFHVALKPNQMAAPGLREPL